MLGGLFTLAVAGLVYELVTNPAIRAPARTATTSRGFVADYAAVLSNRFARIVIAPSASRSRSITSAFESGLSSALISTWASRLSSMSASSKTARVT